MQAICFKKWKIQERFAQFTKKDRFTLLLALTIRRNKIVFNIFQYIVSYWLGWWGNEIDIFDSSQYSELVLTKSNLGKLADILAGADILLDFISMTRQKRKIQIIINSVFKNFKSWFKFFVLGGRWWFPLTAEITQRH